MYSLCAIRGLEPGSFTSGWDFFNSQPKWIMNYDHTRDVDRMWSIIGSFWQDSDFYMRFFMPPPPPPRSMRDGKVRGWVFSWDFFSPPPPPMQCAVMADNCLGRTQMNADDSYISLSWRVVMGNKMADLPQSSLASSIRIHLHTSSFYGHLQISFTANNIQTLRLSVQSTQHLHHLVFVFISLAVAT